MLIPKLTWWIFFFKENALAEREEPKIQADQNVKKKFDGNYGGCWFNEKTKNWWIEMLT